VVLLQLQRAIALTLQEHRMQNRASAFFNPHFKERNAMPRTADKQS